MPRGMILSTPRHSETPSSTRPPTDLFRHLGVVFRGQWSQAADGLDLTVFPGGQHRGVSQPSLVTRIIVKTSAEESEKKITKF